MSGGNFFKIQISCGPKFGKWEVGSCRGSLAISQHSRATLDSTFHLSEPQLAFHEVGGGGKGQDPPAMRVLTLASVCLFRRNIVFREETGKSPTELFRGRTSCLPMSWIAAPVAALQSQSTKACPGRMRGRPGPGAEKPLTTPSKLTHLLLQISPTSAPSCVKQGGLGGDEPEWPSRLS